MTVTVTGIVYPNMNIKHLAINPQWQDKWLYIIVD